MSDDASRPPSTPTANDALRERWDRRWSCSTGSGSPIALLRDHQDLIPGDGKALDLACGLGANALLLARCGLRVSAWDLSPVAIDRLRSAACAAGLQLDAQVRDVQVHPPGPTSLDLICVAHFLDRALAPALAAALRPNGRLFFQTWVGEQHDGRGPSRRAFRLESGELPRLFPSLRLQLYRECGPPGSGFHDQAQLIAESPRG